MVTTALPKRDAGATPTVEWQPRRYGLGLDLQVRASPRLGQKGACGRPAEAPLARHLRIADPLLLRTVVIWRERKPCLLCGFDKAMGQRQDGAVILDEERTALAAIFRTPGHIMFGLPKIRQDVDVAPAAASHLRPAVVIRRVASDIKHSIDRAGAAQHSAARPME